MTQASISTPTQQARVPGDAETFVNGPLPSAYDIPLEDVNPANPRLFAENRWQETFERLRAEDPVHFNETELAGRFWSLTRYEDIKQVDVDWKNFSSAKGIALGFPVDAPLPEGALKVSMFIAQDPPVHDVQRKTVAGVVAPSNLAKMEGLIRSRTAAVLDSLPEQTPFDWVDTVSIELTTMMLATLFDFPFEQRRKLTRWSDVVTAVPGRGVINSVQERRDELLECLSAFTTLGSSKREPGDDLVSMLAHGEETKDMQPMEFLGNLMLLIVGGNDTTRNTMTGSVYGLNQFPEQFAKLKADPTLVPNMVAEIIPLADALSYMRRGQRRLRARGQANQRTTRFSCGTFRQIAIRRSSKTPTPSISPAPTPGPTCPLALASTAAWATGLPSCSSASFGKSSLPASRPSKCLKSQSVPTRPL